MDYKPIYILFCKPDNSIIFCVSHVNISNENIVVSIYNAFLNVNKVAGLV